MVFRTAMYSSLKLNWHSPVKVHKRRRRKTVILMKVASKLKEEGQYEFRIAMNSEDVNCNSSETFHSAIRSVLVAGQCMSLMPVEGISSNNTTKLKYQWLSVRTLYTFCTVSIACLTTILCCQQLCKTGLTFNNSLLAAFSTTTMMTLLLFLWLASQWPQLMQEWEMVENQLSSYYIRPKLTFRFKLYTTFVFILALVEHILANTRAMQKSIQCSEGELLAVIRAYFIYNYNVVFQFLGYSLWKGFVLAAMNIIKTFSLSYMDLFIILISIALTDHFKTFNQQLQQTTDKAKPPDFWYQVRENYNQLARLTSSVDGCISKIIFLSFATNLYFICFQLLNSMRPMRDFTQAVYFYWSIIYLVLKVCAVSLCAASVHDHSKGAKMILYSIPTESYCIEAKRFLMQLTTHEVALTGLHFFSVTRSFMMSIAGTIVTYEIVLLQFNMASEFPPGPTPVSSNITEECEWLNSVQF